MNKETKKLNNLNRKQLMFTFLFLLSILLLVAFQFGIGKEPKLVFQETRQWQIASDAAGDLILLWEDRKSVV